MEKQSTVEIGLDEYKEFIVSQYKNGVLKKTLSDEIAELTIGRDALIESNKELFSKKSLLLEFWFKRTSMGSDTRREQTQYEASGNYGSYFGYTSESRKVLFEFGFTPKDLVDYVNQQWDIREEAEKLQEVKEAKEGE